MRLPRILGCLPLLALAVGCSDDEPDLLTARSTARSALTTSRAVGVLPANASVNALGQASVTIPIQPLPSGNGFAPTLALTYDSGHEGVDLLGYGWSTTALPVVRRCPTRGAGAEARAVRVDDGDALCLDGQRLLQTKGRNLEDGAEYRLEREDFTLVRFSGTGGGTFTVLRKSGDVLTLGASNASRERHSSGATLAWLTERARDASGNLLEARYDGGDGERRLAEMVYGGTASGDPHYRGIRFVYEAAANPVRTYAHGDARSRDQRLSRVELTSDGVVAQTLSLGYETQAPGMDEVLTSAKLCAGAACLPETRFGYDISAANLIAETRIASLYQSTDTAFRNTTLRKVIDVDNDGHDDIVSVNRGEVVVERSTGTGYESPVSRPAGLPVSWTSRREPAFFYDVDADGYVDVLTTVTQLLGDQVTPEKTGVYVLFGSKTGFSPAQQVSTAFGYGTDARSIFLTLEDADRDGRPDLFAFTPDGVKLYLTRPSANGDAEPRVALSPAAGTGGLVLAHFDLAHGFTSQLPREVADVNGDGYPDLVGFGQHEVLVSLGHGARFDEPTAWTRDFVRESALGYGVGDHLRQLVDMNGDGLPDIVGFHVEGVYVGLNTGRGFAPAELWLNDFGTAQRYQNKTQIRGAFDVNGDGYTDLVAFSSARLRVVLGNGRAMGNVAALPASRVLERVHADPTLQRWRKPDHAVSFSDLDGDGMPDLEAFLPNGVLAIRNGSSRTRLTRVVDGFGKETRITYAPGSSADVYRTTQEAAYPLATLPAVGLLATRLEESDGLGGWKSIRYAYEDAVIDRLGRGFLGFGRWITFDETARLRTTAEYGRDVDAFTASLPVLEETARVSADGATTLLSRTETAWRSRVLPSGTRHVFVAETKTQRRDDEGRPLATVVTSYTYDDEGNATQTKVRSTSSTFARTVTTDQTFAPADTTRWILGRLATVTVKHEDGNKPPVVTHARFAYDGAGRLVEEVREPGTAYELRTTNERGSNPFGHVETVTQTWASALGRSLPQGPRVTRVRYDARGFVASTTNPLGHTQEIEARHPTLSLPTRVRDENGRVTTTEYDAFGRAVDVVGPDGVHTRTRRAFCDGGCDGAVATTSVEVDGHGTEVTSLDGLGRVVRVESDAFGNRRARVDTAYAPHGQVARKSAAYFAGSPPADVPWTEMVYDGALRLTGVRHPDGTETRIARSGTALVETNARGYTTTQIVDADGRVLRVVDAKGGVLAYEHDAAGRVVRVVDPTGNVTTVSYDPLGNRTRVVDPSVGATDTTYNALGLPYEVKDAAGGVTRNSYDALGRLVERRATLGAIVDVSTFVYDAAANGVGRLASATRDGVTRTYAYDGAGRLQRSTLAVSGKTYETVQSYDAFGRLAQTTYPSGLAVEHVYDASGARTAVRNAATKKPYWQLVRAYPWGATEQFRAGNGLVTSLSVAPKTGLVDALQTVKADGAVLFAQRYAYDANQNLTARTDDVTGLAERFTYDALDRLETTAGTAGETRLTYDPTGNIERRSDLGVYVYGEACDGVAAGPFAVSRVGDRRYCYDAKGRMVRGDDRTMRYGTSNVPVAIQRGADATTFVYGPDNERVEQRITAGGKARVIRYGAPGYEEIEGPDGIEQRHHLPGGAVVTVQGGVTRESYVLFDQLGSVAAITDAAGEVTERLSFDPWGRRRDPKNGAVLASFSSAVTDLGFAGHEQLDNVELVHMRGRVYDPEIGRFLSPDPLVQDSWSAQSLNRYAYVWNNPLSDTDPSGYWKISAKGLSRSVGKAWGGLTKGLRNPGKSVSDMGVRLNRWVNEPQNQRMIVSTAIAIAASYAAPALVTAGGYTGWAAWAAEAVVVGSGGYASGYVASNGNHDFARKSALTAIAFQSVGFAFKQKAPLDLTQKIAKTAAHGAIGGIVSVAHGGTFESGFLSAGLNEGLHVSGVYGGLRTTLGLSEGNVAYTVAASAAVGGTTSALTGGDFATGARTAMYASLYNEVVHTCGDYMLDALEGLKVLVKQGWDALSFDAGVKVTAGNTEYGASLKGKPSMAATGNGVKAGATSDTVDLEAGPVSVSLDATGGAKLAYEQSIGSRQLQGGGELEAKWKAGGTVSGWDVTSLEAGASAALKAGDYGVSVEGAASVNTTKAGDAVINGGTRALDGFGRDMVQGIYQAYGVP